MPDTELQKKLVKAATTLIGIPYKYGSGPEGAPNSFDCSSFTQYVYRQIGIDLPRSSILQATCGTEISTIPEVWDLMSTEFTNEIRTERAEIGDLLFFRGNKGHYDDSLFPEWRVYIGHVAIYIGGGKIIHANGKTQSVAETPLSEITDPIVMIKRILS